MSKKDELQIQIQQRLIEELAESEKRYCVLFNSSNDAIFVHGFTEDGTPTTFIEVNELACERLGYTKEELLGMSPGDIDDPEKAREVQKVMKKILTNGAVLFDMVHVTKDGRKIPVEINSRMFELKGKRYILSISRDITARKSLEQKLLNAKEEWERTFDAIIDPIIILDTKFRIMRANKAMAEKLSLTPQEAIGLTCYEAVHGTECPGPDCPHAKLLRDGKPHIAEIFEDRLGGYYIVSVSPLHDEAGRLTGSVHYCRDISDRKEMEIELHKALEAKEVLIKEIHHRVKNNLAVIQSLLGLQSRMVKDDESKTYFTESQDRVRSISMIHERLYRAGDLKSIDFCEYIRSLSSQIFKHYKPDIPMVRLNFNLANISVDINTMIPCGLIINELVSNACKYAFPDGKKGELTIELSRKNRNEYVLVVRDNGTGIPEEVDIYNTPSLGMQIVTSLVTQIGGGLEILRRGGTEFRITFTEEALK